MNARAKGKRGELRAVKILKEIWPEARRSANQGAGANQPDVDGTPFWVEVKESIRPNVLKAMEQATHDRTAINDPRPALVLAHWTNGPTLAVMLADDFINLIGKGAINA